MGRNKKLRIRIRALQHMRDLHLQKIMREKERPSPNQALIRHWSTEVAAWERALHRLERRLHRGKQHE
jgi:hypothetical protein